MTKEEQLNQYETSQKTDNAHSEFENDTENKQHEK